MAESVGIKETKELLKFVVELGLAFDKAYADKKFELHELSLLVAPMMDAGPAFEGLDKVGGELKDLTTEEAAELVAFVKDELDLQNDNLEEVIENALEVGLKVYGFIKLLRK